MRPWLQTIAALTAIVGALATGAVGAPLPALNGHVEYETFGYPDPDRSGDRWENFFAATLRAHGHLSSTLSTELEARAVADDVGFTAGAYSLRNATRRRPYLWLITGRLDYRPSDTLRISVGKQIVNWSIIDELQPANLMTPRDESDIFRRIEQGVTGIAAYYGWGATFAEIVVVPLAFTPSRLPQGRWSIIQGDESGDVVQRQNLPPIRFEETQVGMRVGTRFGALQTSLIGYVGRDTAAVFVPGELIFLGIINGSPQFQAQIFTRYPRIRAGGLNASYPIGERLLLRAELVYFTSPEAYREDFLHSIGGIEYVHDDWRLVLNYMRDDETKSADEVTSKGERRFFQSFLFGEVQYDARRRLRAHFRGGYDIDGEFLLLQPEISYRVWGRVRVTLFAEVIDANTSSYADNKQSYFDRIRHEDRLGTRLEYDF